MRPAILLCCVSLAACQNNGRDVRQDDPDAGGRAPDADPGAPDASPPAPDADPGAPDAAPLAPDAEISQVTPEITGTSPTADSSGVEPLIEITATFSTDLDPSTVNATTFTVTRDGAPVAGTVRYADRVATFDPAAPLALGVAYTATVSADVTSNGGAPLAVPVTWTFTVRQGAWSAATQIDHVGDSSAAYPQLAADDLGNVTAVWGETSSELYTARFEPDGRWGTGVHLSTEDGRANSFDVAAAPGGEVVIAWSQERGDHEDLVVRRFAAGAWGAITTLDPDTVHDAAEPDVAFSRDGDAMVIWTRYTGEAHELWASHLDTTWGAPVLLAEGGSQEYERHEPYLGADDRGNYVAVFGQGSNPDGWFTEYLVGAGWSAAAEIPIEHGLWVYVSEVSRDASGTVWTGWSDHPDGVGSSVHVLQRIGGSWTATRLDRLEGTDQRAYGVSVAVAPSGHAVATWKQTDSGGPVKLELWSSRFVAGTGWTEPVRLSDPDMYVWWDDLAIGDDGHAFAVWTEQRDLTSRDQIFVAHQPRGGAWTPAAQVSTGLRAGQPTIIVDATGAATAAWWQVPAVDGDGSIWSARFE